MQGFISHRLEDRLNHQSKESGNIEGQGQSRIILFSLDGVDGLVRDAQLLDHDPFSTRRPETYLWRILAINV